MQYLAEIPYGAYWTTPFVRWQGSFSHLHSIQFAAQVTKAELAKRAIDASVFDCGALGFSVPQRNSFYGLPWLATLAGTPNIGGPTLMQACATGVRVLFTAAQEIQAGLASCALAVTCDRTSNGPHLYYPDPMGPGGTGSHEDWVIENFGCDPNGGHSMLQTAENVAVRHGIGTAEQHEVVLLRESQYREALVDDSAFLRRFMTLPFPVPDARFRKTVAALAGDEGVNVSTPAGLAALKPVNAGGTVTYGAQTHPADGNAGLIVAHADKARELTRNPNIVVRLLGFGQARAEVAYMPEATVPAAMNALKRAGKTMAQIDAIKTHNPFAVNDIFFSRQTGCDLAKMNNFGCSLVWGHPQAPMGTRSIIELIEELAIRGGGTGLFAGCAAGDTAMAVVLDVVDRR
jgi:acetyl-CoA acetyltransferase